MGRKVHENPSKQKKLGVVEHACQSTYTRKLKIGGSMSRLIREKMRPCLKSNQKEKDWGSGSSSRLLA
jgi:hypothetical protein